ncbi:MAG TPA: secondary thiamine-phosphate synthase enzyme YjbQ, partial [Geothermobacteraceae bacterium]|nr:secondary thiamine-phosphate synthase enzyme YjbQ [Geothermobacteraceae bacterium]
MTTIRVSSRHQVEMIDISSQVARVINESGIRDGLVTLFVPHTTAAVTINENADPAVQSDLVMELNKIIPFEDGYRHLEGNSAAHLKSTLVGASETLILKDGALQL